MLTLDNVYPQPAGAIRRASMEWSSNDVKHGVEFALWHMTTHSYYAPYVSRVPVCFEDEFPKMIDDNLEEMDTFACTEGNKVYIDTRRYAEKARVYAGEFGRTDKIAEELEALLAHEYTHVLCEHRAIGESLNRKYKYKVPQGVDICHTLTCEIQANRGSGVGKKTYIYQAGVTEDKFPCTKGLYTYTEIFNALLKEYNERKQEMALLAQAIGDMLKDEAKKKNQSESGGKKGVTGKGSGHKDKKDMEVEATSLTDEEIIEAMNKARDAQQEVLDELVEYGGGYGLDKVDDDTLELNPHNKLEKEFQRWNVNHIKNELKRMKGYVRGSCAKERSKSYSRPSRRNIDPSSSLLKKGVKHENKALPRVLVAMDSSGSMGGTPVTVVATAIGNLFKDLGRPMDGCYIVKHESLCSDPRPLREWEQVVESFSPHGGNCFNNVIKIANKLNVDVVFNIGDGCDCCTRNYYGEDDADVACHEFSSAGRRWIDTIIVDKDSNEYFDSEYNFDQKHGFEREILQLGSEIAKYL